VGVVDEDRELLAALDRLHAARQRRLRRETASDRLVRQCQSLGRRRRGEQVEKL
jgi:hypothetical protein